MGGADPERPAPSRSHGQADALLPATLDEEDRRRALGPWRSRSTRKAWRAGALGQSGQQGAGIGDARRLRPIPKTILYCRSFSAHLKPWPGRAGAARLGLRGKNAQWIVVPICVPRTGTKQFDAAPALAKRLPFCPNNDETLALAP